MKLLFFLAIGAAFGADKSHLRVRPQKRGRFEINVDTDEALDKAKDAGKKVKGAMKKGAKKANEWAQDFCLAAATKPDCQCNKPGPHRPQGVLKTRIGKDGKKDYYYYADDGTTIYMDGSGDYTYINYWYDFNYGGDYYYTWEPSAEYYTPEYYTDYFQDMMFNDETGSVSLETYDWGAVEDDTWDPTYDWGAYDWENMNDSWEPEHDYSYYYGYEFQDTDGNTHYFDKDTGEHSMKEYDGTMHYEEFDALDWEVDMNTIDDEYKENKRPVQFAAQNIAQNIAQNNIPKGGCVCTNPDGTPFQERSTLDLGEVCSKGYEAYCTALNGLCGWKAVSVVGAMALVALILFGAIIKCLCKN